MKHLTNMNLTKALPQITKEKPGIKNQLKLNSWHEFYIIISVAENWHLFLLWTLCKSTTDDAAKNW